MASPQAGCVLKIDEHGWSYYSGSWWGGRTEAGMTRNVIRNATPNGAPPPEETPIGVGHIAVGAEVNASFSLR